MVERVGPSGRPIHTHVEFEPALSRIDDVAVFVASEADGEDRRSDVLKAEQIGRPVGAKASIETLEKQLGRTFSPAKRDSKPRLAPSGEASGEEGRQAKATEQERHLARYVFGGAEGIAALGSPDGTVLSRPAIHVMVEVMMHPPIVARAISSARQRFSRPEAGHLEFESLQNTRVA
jgi:hypothetical protein